MLPSSSNDSSNLALTNVDEQDRRASILKKMLPPEMISTRPGAGGDTSSDGRVNVGVSCFVRVTLKDGASHEDIGYGHAENAKNKFSALEKAKKEASTDGIKRALRMFGDVLGNCLYNRNYLNKSSKFAKRNAAENYTESDLYRPNSIPQITSGSHTNTVQPTNPPDNSILRKEVESSKVPIGHRPSPRKLMNAPIEHDRKAFELTKSEIDDFSFQDYNDYGIQDCEWDTSLDEIIGVIEYETQDSPNNKREILKNPIVTSPSQKKVRVAEIDLFSANLNTDNSNLGANNNSVQNTSKNISYIKPTTIYNTNSNSNSNLNTNTIPNTINNTGSNKNVYPNSSNNANYKTLLNSGNENISSSNITSNKPNNLSLNNSSSCDDSLPNNAPSFAKLPTNSNAIPVNSFKNQYQAPNHSKQGPSVPYRNDILGNSASGFMRASNLHK
ncbi:DNA repair and recombination protein RAD52 [Smittium culicis]|uniref:DNA repair and recombination protein RAD52 n=1 Tax=Smittium culicis TaxID=133412 RepID=A0A1R1Y196_9FUNG|nr:DNA repair and recombination protein RAD52 [Smittium culicis]